MLDKPYDRFVREQIAGDELYQGDPEALVGMGFNRLWIDETNAAGLLTRRQETLDDITNVTGAAFLGLTFGCARCLTWTWPRSKPRRIDSHSPSIVCRGLFAGAHLARQK